MSEEVDPAREYLEQLEVSLRRHGFRRVADCFRSFLRGRVDTLDAAFGISRLSRLKGHPKGVANRMPDDRILYWREIDARLKRGETISQVLAGVTTRNGTPVDERNFRRTYKRIKDILPQLRTTAERASDEREASRAARAAEEERAREQARISRILQKLEAEGSGWLFSADPVVRSRPRVRKTK